MELKKILIVDDEKMARDRIVRFLSESEGPFQIEQAANGVEALERISELKPHIVFLDVQMPGLTGFEVLQQVETRDFQIIFQTAHDEYALRAFDESAVDYLLKPFPKERFDKAMSRALGAQAQQEALQKLERKLKSENRFIDKITFKQGGKLKILRVDDIICFLSQDHCTVVFTVDSEHIIDFSINYLEERLSPERFVRCHRNSIAALEHIKSVSGTSGSEIELSNGRRLALSRSNRKAVLERIK